MNGKENKIKGEVNTLNLDKQATIHHDDCLTALRAMPDASVDSIVTDPPYGLSKTDPASVADTLTKWATGDREHVPTGRGFRGKSWDSFVPPPAVWDECLRVLKPGGHMVVFAGSRTQDLMGLSIRLAGFDIRDSVAWLYGSGFPKSMNVAKAIDKTAGEWSSGVAPQWDGWGTALKPAHEPIIVARKPLAGTVAGNVLEHGTGALNIDACRVGTERRLNSPAGNPSGAEGTVAMGGRWRKDATAQEAVGRWPANVVLDDSQAAALDQQSPDKDGASRFFYTAKASKSERPVVDGTAHPTVKPLAIMRWLIRLITPPGGLVLDPFAGSGTTIEAAILEGFPVIGVERESDYLPLIQDRIDRATALTPPPE
jgi:site-specific DNA-methyltransferase (adenine-specific)